MTQTVGVRIAIVGTTASGKSAFAEMVASALAQRGTPVEIVSADSMCVYRGMDVGTAKPSLDDQARWPTHGIDLVNPDEEFSVAQYQHYCVKLFAEIEQRGAVALVVGGTGLYIDAVVNELTMPPQFDDIKQSLLNELAAGVPVQNIYARLVALDPEAAAKMEPTNERRIVRALEVCMGSGRRFSSFGPGLIAAQSARSSNEDASNEDASNEDASIEHNAGPRWMLCGPTWPRPILRERIATRFSQQLLDGFVAEAKDILDRYGEKRSKTARQALGYRELWDHLEGGRSLNEAVAEAVLRTGQFAVRQERWFRRDPRIAWFPGDAMLDGVTQIVNRVISG